MMSPLGLFTDYPGSNTIWLADDQALDYCALQSIYNSTHNSTALSLANQVNSSIAKWGGFVKYWNPVFEVLSNCPEITQVICGTEQTISVTQGYTVKATVFNSCPGFQYSLFADLLAYHVLLDMHFGNYTGTGAESEFSKLSGMWDSHGFSDQPFQLDSSRTYQSYKLADYVIAWKALADDPATRQFAMGYYTTVQSVAAVMSELQSSAGGVRTGYVVSNNQISYGNGISLTNGETTSLFVFALAGPPAPSETTSTSSNDTTTTSTKSSTTNSTSTTSTTSASSTTATTNYGCCSTSYTTISSNTISSSASSSGGGGIPEFPFQLSFALMATVVIVASYVLTRRVALPRL